MVCNEKGGKCSGRESRGKEADRHDVLRPVASGRDKRPHFDGKLCPLGAVKEGFEWPMRRYCVRKVTGMLGVDKVPSGPHGELCVTWTGGGVSALLSKVGLNVC